MPFNLRDPLLFLEDKLVQEEEMESGTVAFNVYKQYWKSVGHILSISVLLFVLLMQGTFELHFVAVLTLRIDLDVVLY